MISIINIEALKNNCFCLDPACNSENKPLYWMCKEGHEWQRPWKIAKNDNWCNECDKIERINEAKKFAESKYGKCLSDKYIDSKTKLEWQCFNGHKWFSTYHNIVNNDRWCPKCPHSVKRKYKNIKLPI